MEFCQSEKVGTLKFLVTQSIHYLRIYLNFPLKTCKKIFTVSLGETSVSSVYKKEIFVLFFVSDGQIQCAQEYK